jgi:membrane protein implicated in regulation of membrane protease activity
MARARAFLSGTMLREEPRPSPVKRWLKGLGVFVLHVPVLGAIAWMAGALYEDLPAEATSRQVLAVVWLIGALVLWFAVRPHWQARLFVAVAFALLSFWWIRLQPKQDRDWKPEVTNLGSAEVEGDRVTVHNVRNFNYRTVSDFDANWETRTYDLANLRAVDIFINYWGSDWIAHPIVSFDFGPQGRLCFSIEARAQIGQNYSTLGSFYRRFELIYIAADEKDVVRVRANYRGDETVYLYRLKLAPDEVRSRFMEYITHLNGLHEKPAWYNAVTTNCTTSIRAQHPAAERLPFDWRMLLNGKMDGMLYGMNMLDHSLPFEELRKTSLINDRAKAANHDPDFSQKIRAGLPGMD